MLARSLTMGKLGRERRRTAHFLSALPGALALCALIWGCGSTPPSKVAAKPAPATAPADVFDRDWGERDLPRVPAVVRLPDARGWHASASGTFTLLEHRATESRLVLRVWLAPRLVRPERCEADARLARPNLPGGEATGVVEERRLAAPAGFDVRLVVGVEPSGGGVHGYALAVGAATNRCYVAAYETDSAGERADQRVAERLAVVVSGVLETLRVPSAESRALPPPGVE
jgi:hypothetical protein